MENRRDSQSINIGYLVKRLPITWLLTLVVFVYLICPTVAATTADNSSSLIVVLLPATGLNDWLSPQHPQLQELVKSGAVALMNTRTARIQNGSNRESYEAAIFTLSAGMRASAPLSRYCQFYDIDDHLMNGTTAGDYFERRFGIRLNRLNHSTFVDPDWQKVIDSNSNLGYQIYLGNLGDSLQKSGINTYVITGIQGASLNESAIFASGSNGTATLTDITSVADLGKRPNLFVVTLKSPIGFDADIKLLMNIASEMHGRLLVISPYSSDEQYANEDRLTPVALWGYDVKPGVLWSPSTRRNGLITNTDIAPSIVNLFNISLMHSANGRPFKQMPGNSIKSLVNLRSHSLEQRNGQKIMPYIALLLGIWNIYCFAVLKNRRYMRRRLFLIPLAIILSITVSPSLPVFLSIIGFIILGMFLLRRIKLSSALTGMSLALATLIIVDTLCGAPLLQRSILGYSPIEGARYYGIGNEAMGVLIGSLLIVLVSVWNRFNKQGKIGILLGMALVVGIMGTLGSKAGGVIVFTGAFLVFILRIRGKKLNFVSIVYAAIIGFAVLLSIAAIDSMKSGNAQSHLGSSLSLILSHGVKQGFDVVIRKMIVEVHLLYHSTWALPVWLGWIVWFAIRRSIPINDFQRLSLADAGATAAVMSLLFNDAGAVACGLCLSIVISRLAYIVVYNDTEKRYEPETASHKILPEFSPITVSPLE